MMSNVVSYIDSLIKEKNLPYIDVVAYKNHEEIFRYFNGKNKVCGKEKLFMYSCTKPLTVALSFRLIEEGKLSLTDKVCKFLPEYKNAFILKDNGEKEIVGDKITIKSLLTMSAGLSYNRETEEIKRFRKDTQNKAGLVETVNSFIKSPLVFYPNERFEYSLCLDVLAAVIEIVSGEKFSDFMEKIIFNPLEMKNSTVKPIKDKKGLLDIFDFNGKIFKPTDDRYYSFILSDNYESGGAGLISSVEDYIKFADCMASGGISKNGYKLLDKKTIDIIKTEQISSLDVKNQFTCVQGSDYGYGYGVRVRTVPLSCGVPKGEFGWDGAAGSYVLMDTENKISVFIGMNVLSWPQFFYGEHLEIVKRLYTDIK